MHIHHFGLGKYLPWLCAARGVRLAIKLARLSFRYPPVSDDNFPRSAMSTTPACGRTPLLWKPKVAAEHPGIFKRDYIPRAWGK
jgi:hypothetical protein